MNREVYDALGGGQSKATLAGLWNALGDETIACLADGVSVGQCTTGNTRRDRYADV